MIDPNQSNGQVTPAQSSGFISAVLHSKIAPDNKVVYTL